MTQTTSQIGADQSGLAYRNADNAGKQAILNHHKGNPAPAYAEAGMIWLDDTTTPWLLKFYDGADWIVLGEVNATANTFNPYIGTAADRVLNHAADTGTANAYAVAPVPAMTAYATGQLVTLKPANANTGASTLNVNSLGTKNIKLLDGTNPYANALLTTGTYILVYDGTNFVLTNPSPLALTGDVTSSGAVTTLATVNGNVGSFTAANITVNAKGLITAASNGAASSVGYNVQTTTYAPVAGDLAKLVDFTGSSNTTFTLTAAATLGNGWYCYLRNNGTSQAELTLKSSSGSIDGIAAGTGYIMYPGEIRLVQCTGSAFNTAILHGFLRKYASSGTFTVPPGYQAFDCEVWGGGGGGSANAAGGGGGGGAYNRQMVSAAVMSTSQTLTIGAGGSAGVAGGTSSIGSLVLAYGGGFASNTSYGGGGGGGSPFGVGANALTTAGGAGAGYSAGSNGISQGNPCTGLGGAASASGIDGIFGGGGAGGTSGTLQAGSSLGGWGGGGGCSATNGFNTGGNSTYGGGGGAGGGSGNAGVSVYGGSGGASAGNGAVPSGGGGGHSGAGGNGQIIIRGIV